MADTAPFDMTAHEAGVLAEALADVEYWNYGHDGHLAYNNGYLILPEDHAGDSYYGPDKIDPADPEVAEEIDQVRAMRELGRRLSTFAADTRRRTSA